MSLKENVLKRLAESNGYISGEQLAKEFGKSRAAVWKAVKALQSDGHTIESVTNKGYKLAKMQAELSTEAIKAAMRHNIKTEYLESVDSTNSLAKRMIASGIGENEPMLIAAGSQTAGRGRQGKSFYSPAGTGIYMSLVLHPNADLQNAVTATTAASVAVCKAIERLTDIKPKIKWVNDVYVNGRKICGILTEAVSDFESGMVTSVIIGIGINISTTDFPSDVENAGCLNADINRNELVAAVADELLELSLGNYEDFIDYYISRSMIIGCRINYIEKGVSTAATAVSIDKTGGLTVQKENGETVTLRSGEISIRKQ